MPTRSTAMAVRPACGTWGSWKRRCFVRKQGYYADIVDEAAALWESLAQNHPFIDGNKRTAFATTYTFLAINGGYMTADADEIHAFIMGLHEMNDFRFERLSEWLRGNVSFK
jgi:death on curing protein